MASPKIRSLQCRTECMGVMAGHVGSRVRVVGKAMKRTDSVVFEGAPGDADDVSVTPLRAKKKFVDARVPRTAVELPQPAPPRPTPKPVKFGHGGR